ncbi:MAG: hypothetical protein P4L96_09860 [Rhodoferax sp.]|nr:hypothetical protein [Rhodoferax sp.]
MAGQSELMIAGGVESMSRVPMFVGGGAWVTDPQVTIPNRIVPQGVSADLIATLNGYSRRDVDAYAVQSSAPPRPGPKAASPAASCRCARSTASRCWRTTSTCAATPRWNRWPGSSRLSR